MNTSRLLVKPQPLPTELNNLFDCQSDEKSPSDDTAEERKMRVLDAMKSFILNNRGNIPQRKKLTGRRGFGPHQTSASRI